ncbi:lipopolysaccharide heptosyltransferase family protein [Photobacterium sp. CAIM 1938]|uniref:glycosyltransferase family 9 protein n=2 Tax=Photobacterium lucens TaxID=2562949 RepID=UPI00136AE77F|nr:glycosyltransferase family 9 protein [Photobacterium lucens]MBP2699541.1 glycosyltransferase family 9 protein [Vibrio parahaemolyticus]MZG82542.1 lipopolysaccharide heptosyltransferase family protein [Photobacterium lucens]
MFKKFVSSILNRRVNKLSSINALPNKPNVFINATFQIGDYLAISPIIEAVKSKWPESNIIVLCTKKNEDVVKYDPRINYICLPKENQWYKYPSVLRENIDCNADLLIEVSSIEKPHRSIVGYTLNPDLTIGHDYDKHKCIQNPLIQLDNDNISKPEYWSRLMAAYGFNKPSGKFKVFSKENNHIENLIKRENLKDYLVFNPFASRNSRSLSIKKSVDILQKLKNDGFNCVFILPSYIKNKDIWKKELKLVSSVFCVESVQDAIYVIKKSRGVISVDTAIIHIASAYNIPTIGLFKEEQLECKLWHPQSPKNHIGSLTGNIEDIINSTIFH